MRVRLFILALGLVAALITLTPAVAQIGTIRIIIGTAPGGAIDPYARMIAEHMSKTLGQPIIIENKPGASGTIAAQFIAEQPADGTILWLGTQAFTEINPNAYPNARWSIDQFMPIIRGVEAPLRHTVLGFQLNDKFRLDQTHVPYRGSGLQVTGPLGGHSLFGFAQVNSSLPHVRSGKLKALATTGPSRDRSMPDVPTFAELGFSEFTAKVWFGLLVKEGVPPPVLKRLSDAAVAAHNDPAVKQKLEAQGFEVVAETGPQLKTNIKAQIVRWGHLVKASGFTAGDLGSVQ